MVISQVSLFLKYFICIDAIAIDYRMYLLHGQSSRNAWPPIVGPARLTNARSHLDVLPYASAIEPIQTRHFTPGHLIGIATLGISQGANALGCTLKQTGVKL